MKLKIAIIAFFMICATSMMGQNVTVQGVVTDESGFPLPGASVNVEGTTNSASTDFDGKYVIKNLSAASKLVFSFMGTVTQTVAVGGQSVINISLKEEAKTLKEVVVVAYGTQKREKVTGAISALNSADITATPIVNAESALQGRASGVTVVNNGAPGSNPTVIIRGLTTLNNNTPLYVIDGVITGNLSGVNAADIESISVLKDASTAAMYGSQGFNGVVVVTTKKGKKGKGQLTFNTYVGVQTITKRYDVLNTEQYLDYASNFLDATKHAALVARAASFGNKTTNWQDQIFKSGIMRDHNLSFSSGTDTSSSRYSAGYLQQEGALIGTAFERYSFRANNTQTFGKFNVGSNIGVNFSKRNPERDGGGRSLLTHAIKAAPYLPVYNSSNLGGYQGPDDVDEQDSENPVRIAELGSRTINGLGLVGNIFGELEVLKGLKFKSQVGLDYYRSNTNSFVPSYYDGTKHKLNYSETQRDFFFSQRILFNNSLNYKITLADKHNFDVIGLIEKNVLKSSSTGATSRYTISNEVDQLNSSSVERLESSNNATNKLSYIGRLSYDFDEKYLATASIRRDASSRFGANSRWGNFWSASLGWNIAKEKFLEDSGVSTLKLRASIGTTGNDAIGDYNYSATLASLNLVYPIANAAASGTTVGRAANPDLKWEEKLSKNIGLDFGFLNEKITGSFEYFNNEAKDILFNVPLPLSVGSFNDNITKNIASVNSKGFEFSLGYNDREGDFKWSATANFGSSKNEVTKLAPGVSSVLAGPNPRDMGSISRLTVGDPLFYMYGYVTDGIYQTRAEVDAVLSATGTGGVLLNNSDSTPGAPDGVKAGDIRFKDLNGDGQINASDKTKIGNQFPDFNFGLNLTGSYKNFDMSAFISGVSGNDIYNANTFDLQGMQRFFNQGTVVLDRAIVSGGVVTNSGAKLPRVLGANANNAASDRFVEDGSYARLKNITLGYTFKNGTFDKYFSKLRVYASAQNLITITNYSGLDPESGASGEAAGPNANGEANAGGIDFGYYPQPKSVIFGLEVTF